MPKDKRKHGRAFELDVQDDRLDKSTMRLVDSGTSREKDWTCQNTAEYFQTTSSRALYDRPGHWCYGGFEGEPLWPGGREEEADHRLGRKSGTAAGQAQAFEGGVVILMAAEF